MDSVAETPTFVAVSRFVVGNGLEDEVAAAFCQRHRLVDHAPGFLGLEVLRSIEDPREFWLYTRWTDKESFTRWHRSHAYRDAHRGILRGLKLVRGATRLSFFEGIAR